MKRIAILIVFYLSAIQAHAQKVSQVQLIQSQLIKGMGEGGMMRVIKPIFSHENSTLAADSANFNQIQNTFDAFGHVVITQTDGTVVYSDILNYDGNTKLARLTDNVKLVDKGGSTLTTDFLTYNMGTKIGTYTGGGKVVNGTDILTSKNGYYFANSRDSYFRYNVVVLTKDATIKSDTLRYNSASKIAYFYGPTRIYGKDSTVLYTENGEHNTETNQSKFGKKNLYTQNSKSLTGDSLYYDGKTGYGRAVRNITFIDTAQKIVLKGGLAVYHKTDESTIVTKNAYVVFTTEGDSAKVDSIWMSADSLRTKLIARKDLIPVNRAELKSNTELDEPVEEAEPNTQTSEDGLQIGRRRTEYTAGTDSIAADTLKPAAISKTSADSLKRDTLIKSAPTDTTKIRVVLAYHKVKIFKDDLQAKADSAFYSYADSTIRCYINPIVWAQGSQMSADTIYMQLKNKKLDNMLLQRNGFIVSTEGDSSKYNQVKGKILTGLFYKNKLHQMFVDGNAESIYYVREKDSTYSAMNRSVSSRMRVDFRDGKLKNVVFIKKPTMKYYPISKLKKEEEILKGFIWKPRDRPRSKEEIITAPESAEPVKPQPSLPKKPAPKAIASKP